jgi:Leucine-rich repeat (LRR) protein
VVLAVGAVGVGAADVILKGTCTYPGMIKFFNQTVGASDVVRDITIPFNQTCTKKSTTVIEIHDSTFYYIPALLFTTFPNLQTLNIFGSKLQEIRPNTFQNAKNLTNLWLHYNGLTNLNASSFVGASALQEIWIFEPNWTINPNIFKGLPALNAVQLMGANMITVNQTLFADNPKLKRLYLERCSIKSIDLRSLTNLVLLSLGYIGLFSLNKNLLQNNSKLTSFYLYGNGDLCALDDGFFKNNPNLVNIKLYDNQLENIPNALLANTPSLQQLSLGRNKIKSLSSTAFQKFSNLQWLDLSHNLLTSLPKDIFSNNTGLQYIYLNDNKLNAIYQTTFTNLKKMNHLLLKNNVCIDAEFYDSNKPLNSTAVMQALTKCDANANNCANGNSFIKEQLKTVATKLALMANALADVSSIVNSITNNL